MPRPIVIAYHLIWTAYGWWLPNDPRGSTSRRVASDVLAELGELHYGRRKIQPPRRVVREFYDRAGEVLKFALIRKHKHQAEQMIEVLQSASRLRLSTLGLRTPDHPVWATGGWKVFLDHPDAVRQRTHYIEQNPIKHRLPAQHWSFVKPYDGWPLHPGHSPNSPYMKRSLLDSAE